MKKNIVFISIIVLLIFLMVLEARIYQERIQFLERNSGIEVGATMLKEGMLKKDALESFQLQPGGGIIYADTISENERRYSWSARKHRGTLTTLLKLDYGDEISLKDLILEFDKDNRLTWVYFGG